MTTTPPDPSSPERPQRLNISVETLRQELRQEITAGIRTALLELQLDLVKTYATKSETQQLTEDVRRVFDTTNTRFEQMEGKLNILANEKADRDVETKLEQLERDKAGRDAVTNYKKWLTGSALIYTFIVLIQLVFTGYLVFHGSA